MKDALPLFRFIAFLEGCSFLLLGITMPLKYKLNYPTPNYIVGMAHGVLFITYVGLLLLVMQQRKWSWSKGALGFLASLVPFGTFIADKKLFTK